jgi:hypothetical protein
MEPKSLHRLMAELARFRDACFDARRHVDDSRALLMDSSRALRRVTQRQRAHQVRQQARLDKLNREKPTA